MPACLRISKLKEEFSRVSSGDSIILVVHSLLVVGSLVVLSVVWIMNRCPHNYFQRLASSLNQK